MPKPQYKGKVFHSIDEVWRTYFPKDYEKRQEEERMKRMTPEEQARYLGHKWAQEILKEVEKDLEKLNS